ncbi:hypothetical protein ACFOLF_36790 [Paenibacillus sepulcri]
MTQRSSECGSPYSVGSGSAITGAIANLTCGKIVDFLVENISK